MHLKPVFSIASIAFLALPWAAQSRALAVPGLSNHQRSRHQRFEGDALPLDTGLNPSLDKFSEPTRLTIPGISVLPVADSTLVSRATFRGPIKVDPNKADPNEDSGDGDGGAFDPLNPNKNSNGDQESADDGDGGALDPLNPKKDEFVAGENLIELPTNADRSELCARSETGLWSRSLCQPGSGDDAGDGGGFDSEPSITVDPPTTVPPNVGPPVDRRAVENWYDVVQQDPKPQFRAKEALDGRIAGIGEDKPLPDLTNKYIPTIKDEDEMFEVGLMDDVGAMWKELGRTNPGEAESVVIKSGRRGRPVQESVFDKQGKLITALYSNKESDTNPKEQQIPWSELVFHQYHRVMDGDTSKLEAFARSEISNRATITTIETAVARTGQNLESGKIATFRADAEPGSEEAIAFEAISRSDNVNGILFFLSDHYEALGKKTVTRIHVAKKDFFNMIVDVA